MVATQYVSERFSIEGHNQWDNCIEKVDQKASEVDQKASEDGKIKSKDKIKKQFFQFRN